MDLRFSRRLVGVVSSLALVSALVPATAATASPPSGQQAPESGGSGEASQMQVVQDPGEVAHVEGQLIVTFDKGASAHQKSLSMRQIDKQDPVGTQRITQETAGAGPSVLVELPSEKKADELADALEGQKGVKSVQPNYIYYKTEAGNPAGAMAEPNASDDEETDTDDAYLGKQYYLNDIGVSQGSGANVRRAWTGHKTEGGATVAVLDTGCDIDHEDLKDNLDTAQMATVLPESYLTTNPGEVEVKVGKMSDPDGHGTHCAGIAGATANNALGIAGSSYNANVLPVKVFFSYLDLNMQLQYATDSAHLSAAFEYLDGLVESGDLDDLHVISMSLGSYGREDGDDVVESSIKEMREKHDVLTCAAGGNGDSYGNPRTDYSWPSDYDQCLSVTALDRNGNNAYWSDYNKAKDISAPGVDIFSTVSPAGISRSGDYVTGKDGRSYYMKMSGTSMATPLVAGIAALLWGYNPNLTVDEVVEALQSTAHPLSATSQNYHAPDKTGSAGAVDAADALAYVKEHYPASSTPRQSISGASVSGVQAQTFTGSALEPHPAEVKLGDTVLSCGTDYKCVYSDNVNVGTATLVVVGTGKYKGRASTTFEIAPADLASGILKADPLADEPYTGTQIKPVPTMRLGDTAAVEGKDFDLSWDENVKLGTGGITVSAHEGGNYTGSTRVEFKIVARDVDGLEFGEVGEQVYSGDALTPVPQVKMGDAALVPGTDFELRYHDNVNAGTGKILVKGIGNFTGSHELSFPIARCDIASAQVAPVSAQSYTGTAIEPRPEVRLGERVLVKDSDYKISYRHNTTPGHAQFLIAGRGNFTGSLSSDFEIVASSEFSIAPISSVSYTGDTIEPPVTVYAGTARLVEGKDYVVSYRDNVNVGKGRVTVTGLGNYTGQKEAEFPIVGKSLAKGWLGIASPQAYTGSALRPQGTLTLDGHELVAGVDFEIEYRDNVLPGTASAVARGIGNYTGVVSTTFTVSAPRLAAPRAPKATVGKKKAKVSWGTIRFATGYELAYRAKGGSWKVVKASGSQAKSKVLKKLKPGKRYQFKVRAVSKLGSTTYKSAYSKVCTSKKVK